MPPVLRQPPANGLNSPHFVTVNPGEPLIRVYNPSGYSSGPCTFRRHGPLSRFDHHQLPSSPTEFSDDDPNRKILYAAPRLSCCVVEVFGDRHIIDRLAYNVASITILRPVIFLDIRGTAARAAGTVAGICGAVARDQTQAWARYFYEHPQLSHCDGILYASSQNFEDAYALFERAEDAVSCPPHDVMSLNDPRLTSRIQQIADENRLKIVS